MPFQRKLLQKSLQDDLLPEYHLRIRVMLLTALSQSPTLICQALECCQAKVRHWIMIARLGQGYN